jgi:hypothetical protein
MLFAALEAVWEASKAPLDAAFANHAMIARDGPARPAAVSVTPIPQCTSKPAIAGLTCLAAVDHRFGGHAFHSS